MKCNYNIIVLAIIGFLIGFRIKATCAYVIPQVEIKAVQPRGLRISIPDEEGVQLFGFHANINERIARNTPGAISRTVIRPQKGRWTIEDDRISLKKNDTLYYWVYVQALGKPHAKYDLSWVYKKAPKKQNDRDNINNQDDHNTIVSQGSNLIFEENFNTLNSSVWLREVKIPLFPDYEFCIYHNHERSTVIRDGVLHIIPSILENSYGEGATSLGKVQLAECTSTVSDECVREATSYNILPPVISARLTTKRSFSFRYGKISIRAKFPKGAWLYPELWLEPKYSNYGPGYASGRVILGMTRGNDNLIKVNDPSKDYSSKVLRFCLRTGSVMNLREDSVTKKRTSGTWVSGFHVYTTTWSENGFSFQVDGEDLGTLVPNQNGWLHATNASGETNMAPFDQEFYITLGVGVGGVCAFPDGITTGEYEKPWQNTEAKAMLRFWQAKNQWLPTWTSADSTALKVDYVRVWSL
ncbi:beta-1,3-glucan-binding protein isoform X2 [Cephus cinctus]|uniref:Beta-1,3-glucan-binding protein isoform X2 n=1 Tax=Cephus cinctus TaxID=211228 RepID=A0AAJ7VYQ5_CEPCN|nr:beta-1,3-glucan-binding protein isoform X2 [Cephus cinctus]